MIFVNVNDMSVVNSRFSIHRQGIAYIQEIKGSGKFISICEENLLNVINFSESPS